MSEIKHIYQVRPRNDHRGVDLGTTLIGWIIMTLDKSPSRLFGRILEDDMATWPNRLYSMSAPPKITPTGGDLLAEFPMTYTLTNPEGTRKGTLQMSMRLKSVTEGWQVIAIQKNLIRAAKKDKNR